MIHAFQVLKISCKNNSDNNEINELLSSKIMNKDDFFPQPKPSDHIDRIKLKVDK